MIKTIYNMIESAIFRLNMDATIGEENFDTKSENYYEMGRLGYVVNPDQNDEEIINNSDLIDEDLIDNPNPDEELTEDSVFDEEILTENSDLDDEGEIVLGEILEERDTGDSYGYLNQNDPILTSDQAKNLILVGAVTENRMAMDEKRLSKNYHNHLRKIEARVEKASDMSLVLWDEELAELSQAMVDTCVFKHTNLRRPNGVVIGQNLGAVVGVKNSTLQNKRLKKRAIRRLMTAFYREKKFYNQRTNQCENGRICGHYRQVVWSQTKRVGCAYTVCRGNFWRVFGVSNPQLYPNRNILFLACSYSEPMTRMLPPYLPGLRACGNCSEERNRGFRCVNNLLCAPCYRGNTNCRQVNAPDSCVVNRFSAYIPFCRQYLAKTRQQCQSNIMTRTYCIDTCKKLRCRGRNSCNLRNIYPYNIDVSKCIQT